MIAASVNRGPWAAATDGYLNDFRIAGMTVARRLCSRLPAAAAAAAAATTTVTLM